VALGLVRQQSPTAVEGYLDRIEVEAERLNDLIGQLLTLTVMESGNEQQPRETIDLSSLVAEVADDAGFEAEGRKRQVLITDNDQLSVPGNREMLRRALENVVRNAVRYTDEETAVEISLRREGDDTAPWAVISVRDHGPGVPEASLGKLFNPFYRVADARDRQSGGTGVGLAIAERAMQLHGGAIAASNAPDGGLLVKIRLPLKR
jgi:two-component system sensor histidine kinase CpxA